MTQIAYLKQHVGCLSLKAPARMQQGCKSFVTKRGSETALQSVIAIEGFACARPSDAAAHSATVWLRQHDPRAAQNRRRGMEIQRRRLDNAMVMAGMSADGRGRWAVEQVVGQVKQWVKVRWVGFNPRSGLPWPLEWIRRERLTRDLWEQTRLRRPAVPRVKRPAPEMQQDGAPRRRTPRLAGEGALVQR